MIFLHILAQLTHNFHNIKRERRKFRTDQDSGFLSKCVYGLFINIPQSAVFSINDRAKVFAPLEHVNSDIAAEIYEPDNIARLARFVFPAYDYIPFCESFQTY